MKEIVPGVYVETAYTPYNLLLITTSKGGVLVDLPCNAGDGLQWIDEAKKVAKKLKYVVLTCASPERQLAASYCPLPMIASREGRDYIARFHDEHTRRDMLSKLNHAYPAESTAMGDALPKRPQISFDESMDLYMGDRTLHFEPTDGAAPGSLWLYLDEEKLLITGESIAIGAAPLAQYTPDSKAWLNALADLAHRNDVDKVIPGRGRAPILLMEIEEQREVLRVMRRSTRSLTRASSGITPLSAAQDLAQTLFNAEGQRATRQLKAGLERLVEEYRAIKKAEKAAEEAEAAEEEAEDAD